MRKAQPVGVLRKWPEDEANDFLRAVALTTAMLAALAAISSVKEVSIASEALLLRAEAERLANEAATQRSFYDLATAELFIEEELMRSSWTASGKLAPIGLERKVNSLKSGLAVISSRTQGKATERDNRSREVAHLLQAHRVLTEAVFLFDMSIMLGAFAALTIQRMLWWGSMLVGAIGIALVLATT